MIHNTSFLFHLPALLNVQLYKKAGFTTLIFYLLFSGNYIFGQDSNISAGFAIRYGETPEYAQSIRFINPQKNNLPEVLAIFGDSYVQDGDFYEWKNVRVKGLSRHPLQIKLKYERYELDEPLNGIVIDETFEVSILRKGKDFLHESKFWNVWRFRKLFKPFAEPLVYK